MSGSLPPSQLRAPPMPTAAVRGDDRARPATAPPAPTPHTPPQGTQTQRLN